MTTLTQSICLTITKTGRVELDLPIKASTVSLSSITLYLNIYNIDKVTTYTKSGKEVLIQPGYYTLEQLQDLVPNGFKFDKNTLKFEVDGVITGGLKKLIDHHHLYLTPLCLYLYIDGIDTSKNFLDGKRSPLLSIIPIGKTDVGEIFKYQPIRNIKKMYNGEINSLNISLVDERGNAFNGKFVAELLLN